MARPAKYTTSEEQRQANAARQAAFRERQKAVLAEAELDRRQKQNAVREAAREIMKEALTMISYSYRSDIERRWLKRWPWLDGAGATEETG